MNSSGSTTTRTAWRSNAVLLLAAAIWGFAFVAQRIGAAHVGTFSFNAVRFAIGALVLLPVVSWLDARAGRLLDAARAEWLGAFRPGLLCGGFLFAGASLQQAGVEGTTAGHASFITGLYMVIVPVLAIALGQRTGGATWAGVVLGVAGLALLSLRNGLAIGVGDAFVLAGTVFWASHILAVDRFRAADPVRLSAVQFATAAGLSTVSAVLFDASPFGGLGAALLPILYLGVLSTGVAYTLQVVGQRGARASHAALILALESVFGAIGGALVLGETLDARGYAGCSLMLAGILVSQAPWRRVA